MLSEFVFLGILYHGLLRTYLLTGSCSNLKSPCSFVFFFVAAGLVRTISCNLNKMMMEMKFPNNPNFIIYDSISLIPCLDVDIGAQI